MLEDDLPHFVIEAVELVDVSSFRAGQRGTCSAQHEPRMMPALVIRRCASWRPAATPAMTRSVGSGSKEPLRSRRPKGGAQGQDPREGGPNEVPTMGESGAGDKDGVRRIRRRPATWSPGS